jgi:YjbE family integral membrane protein
MFAELFSPEQLTILTQIILIDLVLAGDNAIIIGMVASKFPIEQRKKIIFWGIGGAVILRIILTLLTAYLLQITGLRLLGGLLLLYIVYKLYVDVIKGSSNDEDVKVDNSSFLKAIWTILLADFTMSLDNVLGVAGAAGDHYKLLVFGLILSIALMAFAASLISDWIKKYKWIAWAGLFAILIVAIELIYTDIQIIFL